MPIVFSVNILEFPRYNFSDTSSSFTVSRLSNISVLISSGSSSISATENISLFSPISSGKFSMPVKSILPDVTSPLSPSVAKFATLSAPSRTSKPSISSGNLSISCLFISFAALTNF